jgi:lipid-binding SYLF domain-containing protein
VKAGSSWLSNAQNQIDEQIHDCRSRGIFAGLTLEGAVVEQDADSTTAIYGSEVPFKTILLGDVAAPTPAAPFMRGGRYQSSS